jgi:hypothetical protein
LFPVLGGRSEGLYLPRDEPPSDRVEAVMSKETNRNMKLRLRRETNDSLFPFGFVILTVCGVPFARKVVCK